MIVRTPGGGVAEISVERRGMFAGTGVIPLASSLGGEWTQAGRRVTFNKAVGLPPLLRGIRVLAETVGTLPIIVYRGDPSNPDTRTVVDSAPQYGLLARRPNALQTPFDLKAFMVASILGYGNAYLLKAKSRGRVQELWPLPPEWVTPEPEGTTIKYQVRKGPHERPTPVTRADMIHVPGVLLEQPFVGVSPIMVAANAIGTSLAAQEYAGRFFDRDATPGGILELAGAPGTQVAKDQKELWDDAHRGARHAHGIGVLYGGTKYQQIGVDAQAAQIVETQRWSVDQSANALGLPAWVLGGTDQNPRSTPEERNMELLQFGVAPWLVRIEQALHADDDLFPDKDLAPQFLADGLLRANLLLRYQAYLQGRQAGWLCVDDVRTKENLPELPDGLGKVFQTTPVGGAPNLQPGEKPAESPGALEPAVPVT